MISFKSLFTLIFVAVLIFAPYIFTEQLAYLVNYIESMGTYSYLAFVLVLVTGVVFAPLTVMPVIPVGSMVFGPFTASLLSVIGWTTGASVAFVLSRYLGRDFISGYIPLDKIDNIVSRISPLKQFLIIVVLRHCLPVDVLSFALGLTKSLRFSTYFWATLVGVTYFSFAFSYMGNFFFAGNFWYLFDLALISLAIFSIGWYLLKHITDTH